MISTICKEGNPAHVDDVLSILKAFSRNERLVMKNVITIVKIMLINGDTIATPERIFSMVRRIKSWLWLTMTQRRFNALAILSSNKSLLDKLSKLRVILLTVAQTLQMILEFHSRGSEVMIIKPCNTRV